MMKKIRFPIRIKLTIMSVVTIAISVASLSVFLLISFTNSAYETATNTLTNVANNAYLAIKNAAASTETSMNLLANQIGYNSLFANNILDVSTSNDALNNIRIALSGADGSGDGSTIIGAMDYLIVSDADIKSATMYSPYVNTSILSRLMPTSESKIEFTEDRYNKLLEHPGQSLWFFEGDDELYVWKALVNFGVNDTFDMKVVGYIEYGFDREGFLAALTDTTYTNEGMFLFDGNNTLVLSVSSGLASVDEQVLNASLSLSPGLVKADSYSAYVVETGFRDWKYVAYINHRTIDQTRSDNIWLAILIISISVVTAGLVSFLLSAREIKRIKKLSVAAGDISGGDYNTRIDVEANDEITDVSKSFNTMAEKIAEALNELILQQDSISENFATILSNKSGESGNHVKRVSEYSAILASELGFSESEVHDIRIASMLHDVGKIMIDEKVLHKPGRFTDEEYKIMQQHVVYGGKLLKGVPGNIMQLGAIIAEYHHERWDGVGYVKGLKGNEIPKEAQITSVADVFDALVSKRCYKGAWTIEEAYQEIVIQSGMQFAPDVVEAFKRRFEDFKRIVEIYKED